MATAKKAISIHALVKRATHRLKYRGQLIFYFNPRPREEGDRACQTLSEQLLDFNPRPREEGDKVSFKRRTTQGHFNPRPREEGD